MAETKVALLTAAGSGMGAACARELAEQGYKVAVQSHSGKGEALGKGLGGIGFTGDYADPAVLERAVKGTLDKFGRIDALVNSAAHPPKGPLLDIDDQAWHRGLDMTMLNVIRLSRLVTPAMEKQGGGSIVNISTFAAFEPDPVFPISCCMRAALASFCKLYSDQYATKNIRMNNLLPGFIDSLPLNEKRVQQIPMHRYGTVKEIAKTVAFLVSDGGGYITGQNLRVDGGITRSI
ncbi:MAG: SDR family oxidoreductase [Alphaproteobacteria bacterium]|nr:SDR family oxidoreductase [Alphaproteobacteria bacterium]